MIPQYCFQLIKSGGASGAGPRYHWASVGNETKPQHLAHTCVVSARKLQTQHRHEPGAAHKARNAASRAHCNHRSIRYTPLSAMQSTGTHAAPGGRHCTQDRTQRARRCCRCHRMALQGIPPSASGRCRASANRKSHAEQDGRVALTVGAVEHVDAVVGVLRRVAVHDVHEHHQAQPVRLVDERLQLVGRAGAAGGAEEVGDVVAEGAVVRVLLLGDAGGRRR